MVFSNQTLELCQRFNNSATPLDQLRLLLPEMTTRISSVTSDLLSLNELDTLATVGNTLNGLIGVDLPERQTILGTLGRRVSGGNRVIGQEIGLLHALTPLLAGQEDTRFEDGITGVFGTIARRGDANLLRSAFKLEMDQEPSRVLPFTRLSADHRVRILTQLAGNIKCRDEEIVLQIADAGMNGFEQIQDTTQLLSLRTAIGQRIHSGWDRDSKHRERWLAISNQNIDFHQSKLSTISTPSVEA